MKRKICIISIILISLLFLLTITGFGVLYFINHRPPSSYSFFSLEEENLKKVTYEKEYAAGYTTWNFEGSLIETLNGYENAAGDQFYYDNRGRIRRFIAADVSGKEQAPTLTEEELTSAAQKLVREIASESENIEQLETITDTEGFCTDWNVEEFGKITICLHEDGAISYITAEYHDMIREGRVWHEDPVYRADFKEYMTYLGDPSDGISKPSVFGIEVIDAYHLNLNHKNYACVLVLHTDRNYNQTTQGVVFEYPAGTVFDWWLF